MLRSSLRIAWRNVRRNRSYALLNIAGLATGLTLAFFILLWVHDEWRTDRFHGHGDRLVQVLHTVPSEGGTQTWWNAPYALAEAAAREIPGVEHAVPTTAWTPAFTIRHDGQTVRETGLFADTSFFAVFNFPLVAGNAHAVLDAPGSVVLSETLARRYFGSTAAAVGRSLTIDEADVTVSGVFADVPGHSSLRFDLVRPLQAHAATDANFGHWGNFNTRLYLLLAPEAEPTRVDAALANLFTRHHEATRAEPFVQPIADLYLYGRFENGVAVGGRIEYVRLFLVVALVLLLIAAINFMNLATARATERAREIGVRKAVGSGRAALVGQFLGEALLVALLALGVAVALVSTLLPVASTLTGKPLANLATQPTALLVALGVTVATGLLAGSYPALYLSSFHPARILKGSGPQHTGTASFRKGLVVFQFALSILLIVGTLTAYQQVQFIQTKALGLDRENVIAMSMPHALWEQFDAVRHELTARPEIQNVTRAMHSPLEIGASTSDVSWPGKATNDEVVFHVTHVGYDFTETLRMDLRAGRAFERGRSADSLAYLVNEEAVRAMGLDAPVGTMLSFWGTEAPIVGVVGDFHFRSLHAPIDPLILRLNPAWSGQLFVRTAPGETQAALAHVEALAERLAPEAPFDYTFLDARFEAMYRSEQIISRLAFVFASVALFIACLGLFGLAAFAAQQRRTEIGIRKVLGASLGHLFGLFSGDFLKLVALAFALASPVAYLVADAWLDGFAYRIEMGLGIFVAAGSLALVIALATVSIQALRIAQVDPARSLRGQ